MILAKGFEGELGSKRTVTREDVQLRLLLVRKDSHPGMYGVSSRLWWPLRMPKEAYIESRRACPKPLLTPCGGCLNANQSLCGG